MPERKTENEERLSSKAKDISDYPAHVESFETYYYLGENRTLKETAAIRFSQLVPNYPLGDPNYETKSASFYRKIKRWARAEDWNYWVKRKEITERQLREAEVREKTAHLAQTLKSYQEFIRKSLAIFANRAKLPVLLGEAIARNDADAVAELRNRINRGEGVEIKSFREASELIKMDVYLFETLDKLPQAELEDKSRISEEEAKKIDEIMEFFRRHAKDT